MRKRIFATAPYEADESGVLVPVLPDRCALAEPGSMQACSLSVNHYRSRLTGPCFPLAVVGCSVHQGPCYTLYPPGHVPFGREGAVPCSPSGPLLCEEAPRRPVWEATLFGAAADAAGGVLWPADSPPRDPRRRRTQGRRLTWASELLGIRPDGAQERIASRLGVPAMTLRDAAGMWGNSWASRGKAVLSVLQALPADGGVLDRMLAAGAVAKLWSSPRRWDAVRRTWVSASLIRSPRRERPVARGGGSRPPPPTTSPAAGSPPFL